MADAAIVTGGTGSIGTAVCEALSAAGFVCLAADLVEPAGDSPWEFQRLDVASHASIGELLARAKSLGPLRALVNAHGILRETPWDSEAEEQVDAILDINLKGVFRVTRAVAPMIADGGAIVSLSSVTASMGRTRNAYAYQAAKAGVDTPRACLVNPRNFESVVERGVGLAFPVIVKPNHEGSSKGIYVGNGTNGNGNGNGSGRDGSVVREARDQFAVVRAGARDHAF